jgi:hypothetical protein
MRSRESDDEKHGFFRSFAFIFSLSPQSSTHTLLLQQLQQQPTITTSSAGNSSSGGNHFPAGGGGEASNRKRPGSLFDLVYDEDGSFEQGFGSDADAGLRVQFLRIHVIAFSRTGSVVGLQNTISSDEEEDAAGQAEGKPVIKKNKQNNDRNPDSMGGQEENDLGEGGEDVRRKLIGLKFELFGCYMEPLMSNDETSASSSECMTQTDGTSAASNTMSDQNKQGTGGRGQKANSVRGGRDSAVREYSVNSKANIILLCEITGNFRYDSALPYTLYLLTN